MCYNQFRPALGRPAQPEFALYHIFQKKSNKIFLSNCTIFFPEIALFLCNLHNPPLRSYPNSPPICDPFCLAARARAHMPAAPVGSRPSKIFFTHWATGASHQFSHMAATLLQTLTAARKNFSSLSSEKIGPIAKIERVQ